MGKFLELEKKRYIGFKATTPYLSVPARQAGLYKGKRRPFCLPRELSVENLAPDIRGNALAYFDQHEIKWHDAIDRKPSNHLCDSQVCCINFLFPFARHPEALRRLLSPLFPTIQRILPIENGSQFVAFEWIGLDNYLEERIPRHGKRTRGANFTSADAAILFERQDGRTQIILIEWKYTESYSSTFLRYSRSGTDRTEIYNHLFARADFPLRKERLQGFEDLFYEPFYQLLRQQLLANEMEKAGELGADHVSLLHIAPDHNSDFRRVTSPELRSLGASVVEVWKKLIRREDRFRSISVEDVFGSFPIHEVPEMSGWWEYVGSRYPWILAAPAG